jgi:hypothetical protein
MKYQYMNIEEKLRKLPTASDDKAFYKEEEKFLRLVNEIKEMAGMITNLAKANRRVHY